MTSLHADLNEAAKFVDILMYFTIHIAGLVIVPSLTSTKYKITTIFGLNYEDSLTNL